MSQHNFRGSTRGAGGGASGSRHLKLPDLLDDDRLLILELLVIVCTQDMSGWSDIAAEHRPHTAPHTGYACQLFHSTAARY